MIKTVRFPSAGSCRGAGRGRELLATVSSDNGELMVAFGESDAEAFEYVEGATFRRGDSRITFVLEAGAVDRLDVDQIGGLYVLFPDGG